MKKGSSLTTTERDDIGDCQNKRKRRRRRKKKTVRTLYVSGLPTDVKPREIYLMFRNFNGYQGSILLTRTEEKKPFPVAFVTFENRDFAKIAELALHGTRFDPDQTIPMHIEFAKEDTKNENCEYTMSANMKNDIPSDTIAADNNITTKSYLYTANFQSTYQHVNTYKETLNPNYYSNPLFHPPFFMGMASIPPPPYPGLVLPPPNISLQHIASHEHVPDITMKTGNIL